MKNKKVDRSIAININNNGGQAPTSHPQNAANQRMDIIDLIIKAIVNILIQFYK